MTTLWFDWVLLPEGWGRRVRLTAEAGYIVAIQSGADPGPDDERGVVAAPGLGNLHSHAFQRGMAGLAETRGPSGDDFWTWRDIMYRFIDQLTPDDVEAIAAEAYCEMIETGFTRVGEFHYLHHSPAGEPYDNPAEMAVRIAAAAQTVGIGLTLLPVFYAQAGFGGAPPGPAQRRFINTPERYARLIEASRCAVSELPDAVIGIAPHSLRAVTPDQLTAILPLAPTGPVHIHIAEQSREVEDCLAWSGLRPVEWLMRHADVDPRWCLVHATHMTQAETSALAASGAVAGLCPITEANLGDGVFPASAFLDAGGQFGIGSDSNVLISSAEELRLLEYGQRLDRRARNVLVASGEASTGASLFKSALRGGAQALGVRQPGLRVGAPMDLISFASDHPSMIGREGDQVLDAWIFAAGEGAIDGVWRRGRRLVTHGRHHDRARIVSRYRSVLERLLSA